MSSGAAVGAARQGTQMVLLTLTAGQFLTTLDSSVANDSIATLAKDVGTSVTGTHLAITLYTPVMAMLNGDRRQGRFEDRSGACLHDLLLHPCDRAP